jgi:hypothetical protein
MSTPTKHTSLQAYQVLFYDRTLSADLFKVRAMKTIRQPGYELEAWLMPGTHVLRYLRQDGPPCCELVTDTDRPMPQAGVVGGFLAAGEHEFEHTFEPSGVTYMLSVQTETLSDNVYAEVFDEIHDLARLSNALIHAWNDDSGRCMSVVDLQRQPKEVHVQAYHLIANQGLVVRTQSLFEHR